jgi:hypothetical protein
MSTVNTLMGTWAPRLQMDLVPGIACAAHFVLKARHERRGRSTITSRRGAQCSASG